MHNVESRMYWDQMTVDEFAICRQAEGLKVAKIDGIWWVEIRPFFFRPLFPFAEINPWSRRYPIKAFVGGFLHLVPSGVPANSNMNFYVYDDLENYSLSRLTHKRRRIIKQGIKNFVARQITDVYEFNETAYEVFLSFHNRTKYWYKENRIDRNVFVAWGKQLFDNPKIRKLGAYHDDKLSAVEISLYVEDVIIGDTMFADDAGLKMRVTDFVVHTLRDAAVDSGARYLFAGLPTGVITLDESKLERGCKLLKMPAYYKINPVALSVAKVFMKTSYQKLLMITAPPPAPGEVLNHELMAGADTEGQSDQSYLQGPN
jgi:hypothetical protein